MSGKKNISPTIIFIFGGSGDLTTRKLIPALYNLYVDNYLPEKYSIIGIGRDVFDSRESYQNKLKEGILQYSRRKEDIDETWGSFANGVNYHELDLLAVESYSFLQQIIEEKKAEWGTDASVIYYLAVAPQLAPKIAQNLSSQKICNDPHKTRIVFEKPFGHDLASANGLNNLLTGLFDEEQIYRIDHYLGKETVQNILAFRFGNILFEPIWNKNFIEYVEITAAETVGVEERGSYYENSGALRDMVQNHILQLLCMVAMEPPASFAANEIRNKKADVLNAIRKISQDEVQHNVVRGQYGAGWIKGKEVIGYRQDEKVSDTSSVETFVAGRFFVDNWRWEHVPFYIRSGKSMAEKATFITIQFKDAPKYAFTKKAVNAWKPNRLTISIQPEMEIRIKLQAKRPGPEMILNPVDMVFSYNQNFTEQEPEAYETLLEDVIEGNPTLFMRSDQIVEAWKIITPILEKWHNTEAIDFPNYTPGTWGPNEANDLLAKFGHTWINPNTK